MRPMSAAETLAGSRFRLKIVPLLITAALGYLVPFAGAWLA